MSEPPKVNLREGLTLLRDESEARGRRVVQVSGDYWQAIAITFDDGTTLVLGGVGNCDYGETYGDGHYVHATLHVWNEYDIARNMRGEDIATLGITDDAENARLIAADKAAREKSDRETYERLKERFANANP